MKTNLINLILTGIIILIPPFLFSQVENVKIDTSIYESEGRKEVIYSQKIDGKEVFLKEYVNDTLVTYLVENDGIFTQKFWYENGAFLGQSTYKYVYSENEEKEIQVGIGESLTLNQNGDSLRYIYFGDATIDFIEESELYEWEHWRKKIEFEYFEDGSIKSRKEMERPNKGPNYNYYLVGWQIKYYKDKNSHTKSFYALPQGSGQRKIQEVGLFIMESGPSIKTVHEGYDENGNLTNIWEINTKFATGKSFYKGKLRHQWKSSLKFVAEHSIENDFENEIWYNEDGSFENKKGNWD